MKRRLQASCLGAAIVLAMPPIIPPALAQTKHKHSHADKQTGKRTPSVEVVNNPAPRYLSGEVSIAVRSNENPIIRLGLAQNGVSLIEFPASDRFFAINPGNPDLVMIEDSPTKETDRFFVIRPGSGFAPALENTKVPQQATSIIVQMNSGMVVTFLIYPARDIEHNAHRCVVMYDPKAITNARRAAGLAIQLDKSDGKEASEFGKPQAAAIRPTSQAEAHLPANTAVPTNSQSPGSPPKVEEGAKERPTQTPAMVEFPVIEGKERWGKTIHGLKIAAQTRLLDARQRQVLLTVQNTLSLPVRLVPGHPELQIQTLDDKGRVLQVEPVTQLKFASSATQGMIAPKQAARFLLTYEAPVLGAKQRLCVTVAQVNAADEPATVELTSGTR